MKKIKYYSFLDVTMDIFYGIVLYNAYIAFPGFKIESMLMVLSIIVMLNYWWITRSYAELPKYYLFDFYMIGLIMFIFSQWPNYYFNLPYFIFIITLLFFLDGIYSLLDIYIHKEKKDHKSLYFYFIIEILIGFYYLFSSFVLKETNWFAIVMLFLPYIVFWAMAFKKGLLKTKFIDTENQPY